MRRCQVVYQVVRRLPAFLCFAFMVPGVSPRVLAAQAFGRPAVCRTLAAAQQLQGDGPGDVDSSDTLRLQAALDSCPAGQTVELIAAGPASAFVSGPLLIPSGVSLWIDPRVVLFASRNPSEFVTPDGNARPLLSVAAGGANGLPITIAGYGIIDARGSAVLLHTAPGSPRTWFDLPADRRPDLLQVQDGGDLTVAGITLRDAPGAAVRYTVAGKLLLQDAKLLSHMDLPGTQALVSVPGTSSVRVVGSVLAAAGSALTTSRNTTILITETALYGGELPGIAGYAPCLAEVDSSLSGVAPNCLPASLPALRGELVQSGPKEMAAVLTVPDLRLPAAAGTVDLLEGDTVLLSATVHASAAVFDLSSLPAGPHRLHARLREQDFRFGDLVFPPPRARRADTPPTLNLTASATTFPYGTALTLMASLPAANGLVSFLDGNTSLGQAMMSGGSASLTLSTLALGPHTVTALYAGDALNPAQTSPALTLQVNPVTTIVSLRSLPASIPFGATLMLGGTVLPVTAGGLLTFYDGPRTLGQATLTDGAAGIAVTGLEPGQHTLTAAYAGDRYDLAASSPAVAVTVSQLPTTTALAATPPVISFGAQIQLAVTVSPGDASGSVTVSDGVTVVARIPLGSGAGSATLSSLQPGLHLLQAVYAGDAAHVSSASSTIAVQVDRLATTTSLAPLPASLAQGKPILLSANVLPAAATGTVTFLDRNSGPLGQANLVAGTATLTLPALAAGAHSITASYAGDADDAGSTSVPADIAVTLNSANLTLTGVPASVPYAAPETLLAQLNPGSATGSITLTDAVGGPLGTALVAAGSASWNLPLLAPGPHLLRAQYSGDSSFGPTASSVQVTVLPDATTTELTVAQQAVTAGSPVLLNLRVATAFSNSPTGTVQVRVGGNTYSATLTHPLPGQSFATLSVDSTVLGIGSFTASAQYGGDAYDQASASTSVSFNIIPTPVSLILTLASQQIPAGTPLQLSASVSSANGVPTGSLSFFRDGILIATQPAGNGQASATLPGLPVGTYAITASYAPTGLFGPAVAPTQFLYVGLPIIIALNPNSLVLHPGEDGSSTVSVIGFGGYAGAFVTTCASPVSYLTCSLEPATGSTPGAATVHLHVAANTYSQTRRAPGSSALALLALLWPACLLARRSGDGRRHLRLLGVLLAGVGLLSLTACGAGTFFDLPPGSWTVTVSVTASGTTVSAPLTIQIAD